MKPNFFVIGAGKAGTTSLCGLLSQHPQVFFSERKELHFFSFDEVHAQGVNWYESWFEGAQQHVAVGEGSTTYSIRQLFPEAAGRLAAYAPSARLIYIVREPFARMESTWLQLRRLTAAPFKAVGASEVPPGMRTDRSFNTAVRRQSKVIVSSTNYWSELEAYRAYIPDERILVLQFEQLCAAPADVLGRCFEFLGVDPHVPTEPLHANMRSEYVHPHPLLHWIWASPTRARLYARLAGLVPHSVRQSVSARFLDERGPARPTWEPATRDWARDQLEPDLRRFCAHWGLDADAWFT